MRNAAAQYTLIRGFDLHVMRTRIGQQADRLSADAVYTISVPSAGNENNHAEVVVTQRA